MIPGGHLTQKLLTKVSTLFVTNELSQTPSARASQNGSEDRGNEWTRLRDFCQV